MSYVKKVENGYTVEYHDVARSRFYTYIAYSIKEVLIAVSLLLKKM